LINPSGNTLPGLQTTLTTEVADQPAGVQSVEDQGEINEDARLG